MDALVVYRYRAADAQRSNEITIRSDEKDVDLPQFQTSPHRIGDTVTLQAQEDEEAAIERLGKDPKEYVVNKCVHVLSQVADHPYQLTVYVDVTDPGS